MSFARTALLVLGASVMAAPLAHAEDKATPAQCEKALDRLATNNEKAGGGPKKAYIAANHDNMMRGCLKFSRARVMCVMKMPDNSGDSWAKCPPK